MFRCAVVVTIFVLFFGDTFGVTTLGVAYNSGQFLLKNRGAATYANINFNNDQIIENKVDTLQFTASASSYDVSGYCCTYGCCSFDIFGDCLAACSSCHNYNNGIATGGNYNTFTNSDTSIGTNYCTATIFWAPYQESSISCTQTISTSSTISFTYSHWTRPTIHAFGVNYYAVITNGGGCNYGGYSGHALVNEIYVYGVGFNIPPMLFVAEEPILTSGLYSVPNQQYTGSITPSTASSPSGVGTTYQLTLSISAYYLTTIGFIIENLIPGSYTNNEVVTTYPNGSFFGAPGAAYVTGSSNIYGNGNVIFTFKSAGAYVVTLVMARSGGTGSSYFSINVQVNIIPTSTQTRYSEGHDIVNPVY